MSKFLTRYNHAAPVTACPGVSMTDEQYAAECDMNTIVKKAGLGIPPNAREGGSYGDYSAIPEFPALMERCEAAKRDFAALPSDIRDRFGNDPKAYFAYVLDPANNAECVRLGIKTLPKHEETAVDVLRDIRKSVTASAVAPVTSGASVG